MATPGFDLVPITPQKHDPAWKHCQMYKNGDKVQLKCVYCGKFFRGGGIYRIKEHLAGHKGNAATCLSVPPDVRLLMQQSLDGLVVRKRKKQKLAEGIADVNNNSNENNMIVVCDLDSSGNQRDIVVNSETQLIGVPVDNIAPISSLLVDIDETKGSISGEKKKRGRPKTSMGTVSTSMVPSPVVINSNGLGVRKTNDHVHMAIGRFLYDIGAPFDAVNSAYFKPMVDAIASGGPVVIPPSYHDIRGWILKNSVQEVKNDFDKLMAGWGRTGCSILVDERNAGNDGIFLSFMVYSPEGTVFLKSVDASSARNSPNDLFELIKEVVEEVGASHVLQVITNGEEDQYIDPGKRLMDTFPNLFWTSCSTRFLDLILEDFAELEWIKAIILQAKSITRFVYNHTFVLNMVRRFTCGNDIIDVGATRNASNFTTLKRIVDLKPALEGMITSQEWADSSYSRKHEVETTLDIINDQLFWSSCTLIVKLTAPLLSVLEIVNGDKRPAMGYLYAGMYRVKETIKKELVNRNEYMVYWDIIDRRWKQQLDNPLLAAGFYLNPKYFYSVEGQMQSLIQSKMFDCIERLVPDTNVQDKITKELNSYKNAAGDFGRKMAVRARDTLLPAEWWSTYGESCPNLARLAIRILSQTCSSTGSTRNQITLEKFRDANNCLERQRLRDLVFVQNNLRLRQKGCEKKEPNMMDEVSKGTIMAFFRRCEKKEQNVMDAVSLHGIDIAEDWLSGNNEDNGSSDWMALDPMSTKTTPPGTLNDEVEELGAGFDDYEVFDSMKGREEVKIEFKVKNEFNGGSQ